MATQPTNLPVPSESPRDLKFNAGKIDEYVTSMGWTYIDRFGDKHYTIEGLNWLAKQAIASFGYVTIDSFQIGATLTTTNQVLRWTLPDGDGNYYRWDGAFPKDVPLNSTPSNSGGIGAGKWLSVGDASSTQIISYEGVKHSDRGIFGAGVTILTNSDVVQDQVTGWYYSYLGTLPHVIAVGEVIDSNWKALGNLNGFAYNHFLNWQNELVTDEQALTAAFNTGYEVDLSGEVATTTVDYTIPAGSKGLKGGTLMLGGRLSTVPYDFGPASLFGSSTRAGVSVIRLDGTDRTGQLIRIDNGYTFCINDALAPGVTPDSIDGMALTKELNSYKSEYIQPVRVIGHTSGGDAILSEPLVVNIVAGRSKWHQCTGNLTPFHLSRVNIFPTSGTRRTLWLAQVDLVIEHCYFKDCTIEMHYGCYNSRFIHNDYVITTKEHLDNDQPRISFSIQSSVAEIAHNKISSTGVGDSDIAVYKQIAYVNIHDNQIASPIIGNSWYSNDHWSVVFHSAVYHCQAHNNNTSSQTGIGAFVFCDDIQISNNLIKCNVLISAFCHTVLYIDNSIVSEGSSSFIGNTRLVVNGGQWNIREGGQRSGLILSPSAKPFNADGFKVIDSSVLSVDGTYFYSTSKNPYLNPKTLMTAPTSGSDTVFPLNNAHLANQSVGIHMSNVKLDFIEVKNCTFQNLNYGINMYRSISALGQVRVEFSNNDFTCDAGICMRGTSGFRHYAGNISDNTFGVDCLYGVINANIQGVGIVNCKFMSFGGSGVLVASASNTALQCVMATNCSFDGASGSGFKYYDFNGYIGSYSLSPTQAGCNFLPHGLWFYQPSENILTSSGTGFEYCNSAYFNGSSFVGAILKKQNTITTIP